MIYTITEKTGAEVYTPINPALAGVLDDVNSRRTGPAFLVTQYGKPRTARGFSTWFRILCDEAGLPRDLSAHGLRVRFASHSADCGSTASEIGAQIGDKSLRMAELYTRAADRKRMSVNAMRKIEQRTNDGNPVAGFPKSLTKSLNCKDKIYP
jgi:integrase